MKSCAIIGLICAMLIITSDAMPTQANAYAAVSAKNHAPPGTQNAPEILPGKKAKNNRLPRWHRVIPGMIS
jgi:hypothetical protein